MRTPRHERRPGGADKAHASGLLPAVRTPVTSAIIIHNDPRGTFTGDRPRFGFRVGWSLYIGLFKR